MERSTAPKESPQPRDGLRAFLRRRLPGLMRRDGRSGVRHAFRTCVCLNGCTRRSRPSVQDARFSQERCPSGAAKMVPWSERVQGFGARQGCETWLLVVPAHSPPPLDQPVCGAPDGWRLMCIPCTEVASYVPAQGEGLCDFVLRFRNRAESVASTHLPNNIHAFELGGVDNRCASATSLSHSGGDLGPFIRPGNKGVCP